MNICSIWELTPWQRSCSLINLPYSTLPRGTHTCKMGHIDHSHTVGITTCEALQPIRYLMANQVAQYQYHDQCTTPEVYWSWACSSSKLFLLWLLWFTDYTAAQWSTHFISFGEAKDIINIYELCYVMLNPFSEKSTTSPGLVGKRRCKTFSLQ